MKLLRVGAPGAEKPAVLGPDGVVRDLSGQIREFDAEALSADGIARLAKLDPASLPAAQGSFRIGPPVPRPVNFVCIGLNYADHAAETGSPIPKEPIVFLKALGAFQGPNDEVRIPRGSTKTDWEVELGIVIGTKATYVPEHD
ncbi:MAG: fumarylacetoacetate hydrolase family protein, partial [Acetobacteraceae bacterium]|nr:fumarylacetoacetate hydrolase family protein [Acetobacteraceae bacterium]